MKQLLTTLALLCLLGTMENSYAQSSDKEIIEEQLRLLEQKYAKQLRDLDNENVEYYGEEQDSVSLRINYLETKQRYMSTLDGLESAPQDQFNAAFATNLEATRDLLAQRSSRTFESLAYVKVDQALYNFLQTDFMKQYRDLRIDAESVVSTFKTLGQNLEPAEVAKLRTAYTLVADEFNRFLVDIKRDFLDRKKLKMIRDNKEVYASSLQYKLRELQDLYAEEFQSVAVEISGSDVYSLPLTAILGLIKLAADLTDFIIQTKVAVRTVKEDHLNRFLLGPFSFRPWYEIEMIEGNIYQDSYNDEMYQEEIYSEEPASMIDSLLQEDPFMDEPAPSLSRKKGSN